MPMTQAGNVIDRICGQGRGSYGSVQGEHRGHRGGHRGGARAMPDCTTVTVSGRAGRMLFL